MRAIRDIQEATAKEFGYEVSTLLYGGQTKCVARARCAAMLLARRLPATPSYPEIGKAFGRDHTTVMSAVKRAQKLEASEPWFAQALARIEARLGRRPGIAVARFRVGEERVA